MSPFVEHIFSLGFALIWYGIFYMKQNLKFSIVTVIIVDLINQKKKKKMKSGTVILALRII